MANTKYLGEIEFINAITSIQKKIEQASSFDEAVPCNADATYMDENSVAVPAVVRVKSVKNKHQPDAPYYKVRLDVTLAGYGFEGMLVIGTKEEVVDWLSKSADYEAATKLLFDAYRGAWESVDSVRFRDY